MDYQLTQLPNGLKVVTIPMQDRETVAVAIWVRVGSRYEPLRSSGLSHFMEHMLFKGTRRRSTRQIKAEIEGVGGMLNAFTSEETTCFFAKVMKDHYSGALDVLADMVNHATLKPDEIRKEKTVIVEEIKMYQDLPSHEVFELLGEMVWPNQPLGRNLAGSEKTVMSFTRPDVTKFKQRFYHPGNLVLSVSGPVFHEEILEQARSLFGDKPRHAVSRFPKARISRRGPRTRFCDKETAQTHFVIGFHSVSRYHAYRYAVGLLSVMLGGNMSSRLYEELREKRGLAYEIRAGASFLQDTGCFTVSAGVEPEKATTAISVVLRELGKICHSRMSERELRRAKDYFLTQLWMALEDTLDHMLWAGERMVYSDDLPSLNSLRRGIEQVTVRDMQEAARQIFQTQNLHLALIGKLNAKQQRRIKESFVIPGA
ncbi:MAG: pitrilysin family protein [Candidatus Omnitrophota bacterium]|nr:pitrilysin family protein [Candidatus Omnitrophota bacterium]